MPKKYNQRKQKQLAAQAKTPFKTQLKFGFLTFTVWVRPNSLLHRLVVSYLSKEKARPEPELIPLPKERSYRASRALRMMMSAAIGGDIAALFGFSLLIMNPDGPYDPLTGRAQISKKRENEISNAIDILLWMAVFTAAIVFRMVYAEHQFNKKACKQYEAELKAEDQLKLEEEDFRKLSEYFFRKYRKVYNEIENLKEASSQLALVNRIAKINIEIIELYFRDPERDEFLIKQFSSVLSFMATRLLKAKKLLSYLPPFYEGILAWHNGNILDAKAHFKAEIFKIVDGDCELSEKELPIYFLVALSFEKETHENHELTDENLLWAYTIFIWSCKANLLEDTTKTKLESIKAKRFQLLEKIKNKNDNPLDEKQPHASRIPKRNAAERREHFRLSNHTIHSQLRLAERLKQKLLKRQAQQDRMEDDRKNAIYIQIPNFLQATHKSFNNKEYLIVSGGYVRDETLKHLLGVNEEKVDAVPTADIDLLTNATTETLERHQFKKNPFLPVFHNKATKVDIWQDTELDVLSDEALAAHLEKKDFTINAFLADILTGKVSDLTARALNDLRGGIVDTLEEDARTLFERDPTCILRAVHLRNKMNFYFQKYIHFKFSDNLTTGLQECAECILFSNEKDKAVRIQKLRHINFNFCKLFTSPFRLENLETLNMFGLMEIAFPFLGAHLVIMQKWFNKVLEIVEEPNLNFIYALFITGAAIVQLANESNSSLTTEFIIAKTEAIKQRSEFIRQNTPLFQANFDQQFNFASLIVRSIELFKENCGKNSEKAIDAPAIRY